MDKKEKWLSARIYVTVREAAILFGCSTSSVYRKINAGEILPQFLNGQSPIYISVSEICMIKAANG